MIVQFGPETCEAKLVSLNLVSLKEPNISYIQIPSLHPGQQSTLHLCVAGTCHFVLRFHAIAYLHTIRAQVAVNKAQRHLAPIHGIENASVPLHCIYVRVMNP